MARSGFFEDRQRTYQAPSGAGPQSVARVRLKIDQAGRVVIPADMRTAMMVKPGDEVSAEVADGELRIIAPRVAIRRLQEIGKKWQAAHPGVDLVQDLIAERRAEARQEAEEADAWRAERGLPPLE